MGVAAVLICSTMMAKKKKAFHWICCAPTRLHQLGSILNLQQVLPRLKSYSNPPLLLLIHGTCLLLIKHHLVGCLRGIYPSKNKMT